MDSDLSANRRQRFDSKREVRERDNYTCQYPGCGHYDKHIDVHHKAKRSQRPDLKFEVSNAVCLCRSHHSWTDYNHDKAVSMGLLDTTSYELAKKGETDGLTEVAPMEV